MTLILTDGSAIFGYSLPLDRMPDLMSAFLRKYPDTVNVEILGRELAQGDYEQSAIPGFINAVCRWGDYAGIAARVLNQNPVSEIRLAFKTAAEHLAEDPPATGRALAEVNTVRGLGTPSFASKHLRFLAPHACPVFDSILRDVLPYSFDPDGYAVFAADCHRLAATLSERGISNPYPLRRDRWAAADVEASLFCHVNGWLQ